MKNWPIFTVFSLLLLFGTPGNHLTNGSEHEVTLIYGDIRHYSDFSPYSREHSNRIWHRAVMLGMYEPSNNQNNPWKPAIAGSLPIPSDDNLKFTIELKSNLLFSNGDPITAEDIIFSYKVASTPMINQAFYGTSLGFMGNDSIQKIDDFEIEITLEQAHPFPMQLFSVPIIPSEVFEERYNACISSELEEDCTWNNPDLSDIIGAGPFKAQTFDETNMVITLVENENYYRHENRVGNVQKIVFKEIEDNTDETIHGFYTEKYDILSDAYGYDPERYEGYPHLFLLETIGASHVELGLNHEHPYYGTGTAIPGNHGESEEHGLADALLIRRAMSHAVNRTSLIHDTLINGLGVPAATSVSPIMFGHNSSITPDAYNIEHAKSLMTDAGFDYSQISDLDDDGIYDEYFFDMKIIGLFGSVWRPVWLTAEIMDDMRRIGINYEFGTNAWSDVMFRTFAYPAGNYDNGHNGLVPIYDNGGFDVYGTTWYFGMEWNPLGLYDSSGSYATGNTGNYYNFDQNRSPELKTNIEPLLTEYLSEYDYLEKKKLSSQLQHEIYENLPVISMVHPGFAYPVSERIHNIDPFLFSYGNGGWESIIKLHPSETTIDEITSTTDILINTTSESSGTEIISTEESSPILTRTTDQSDITSDDDAGISFNNVFWTVVAVALINYIGKSTKFRKIRKIR